MGLGRSIFISYSGDAGTVPATLATNLEAKGHRVFLDRNSLPSAGGYDDRIREAVAQSDLMVFFISPGSTRRASSTQDGSYALTELGWAQKQWPNPEGRVLPVQLGDDRNIEVPAYLKANVSIFRPTGSAKAEIADEVSRLLAALDAGQAGTTEAKASSGRSKARTSRAEWAVRGIVVLFIATIFGWMMFKDSRVSRCVSKRLVGQGVEPEQAEFVASRSTHSGDKAVIIRSAGEPDLFRLVALRPVFKVVADCAIEHERDPPVLVFNSTIRVETEQRSPVSSASVRLQDAQCKTDATGSCKLPSELRVEAGETHALSVSHPAFQPFTEEGPTAALGQSPVVIFLKKVAADAH